MKKSFFPKKLLDISSFTETLLTNFRIHPLRKNFQFASHTTLDYTDCWSQEKKLRKQRCCSSPQLLVIEFYSTPSIVMNNMEILHYYYYYYQLIEAPSHMRPKQLSTPLLHPNDILVPFHIIICIIRISLTKFITKVECSPNLYNKRIKKMEIFLIFISVLFKEVTKAIFIIFK